jgi:hypothetical protein
VYHQPLRLSLNVEVRTQKTIWLAVFDGGKESLSDRNDIHEAIAFQ